jgi:hypothetical protein
VNHEEHVKVHPIAAGAARAESHTGQWESRFLLPERHALPADGELDLHCVLRANRLGTLLIRSTEYALETPHPATWRRWGVSFRSRDPNGHRALQDAPSPHFDPSCTDRPAAWLLVRDVTRVSPVPRPCVADGRERARGCPANAAGQSHRRESV